MKEILEYFDNQTAVCLFVCFAVIQRQSMVGYERSW